METLETIEALDAIAARVAKIRAALIGAPVLAPYDVPEEVLALDARERIFVEGVVLDGLNLAEAARRARYSDSYQTRLRRRPKIRAALIALRLPDSDRLIASVAQLRESLSETALTADKAADRNGAASLLLKVEGALGPETYVDARVQSITYQVGAGSPLALLDVLDALGRLAAGETVESKDAARILESYVSSNEDATPCLGQDVAKGGSAHPDRVDP